MDVGLRLGFLPIRRTDRVEHPAAIRARRVRPAGLHLLDVHEGERALLGRSRHREHDKEQECDET